MVAGLAYAVTESGVLDRRIANGQVAYVPAVVQASFVGIPDMDDFDVSLEKDAR